MLWIGQELRQADVLRSGCKTRSSDMMDGWTGDVGEQVGETDMARTTSKSVADETRVASYVDRLVALKRDEAAFKQVFGQLAADKSLNVADVVEIAQRYRRGGLKAASKKAALEIVSKRFLELIRIEAQIAQAQKARPW
jgi:hypothetical protein